MIVTNKLWKKRPKVLINNMIPGTNSLAKKQCLYKYNIN